MSSFTDVMNGTTVDFSSSRTSTANTTSTPSVVVDPSTGNPFGAVTNAGKLGSGLSGVGGFGDNIVGRLGSGDTSLQGLMSSSVGSGYSSNSTEMADSDKRLNVIRSRASRSLYTEGGSAYTSDRGPIAYMRLLKNSEFDERKAVEGTKSNVNTEMSELLSNSGFTKFFLTGVNVQYSEKTQIMTTFGDNEVVYYFGKQPTMFNLSGILFDSLKNDWFSKFLTLYARVLRGTELAKNFNLVELTLPNLKLIGTISSLTHQQDSQRDTDISFSIQFIAKEVEPLPTEVPSGSVSNLQGSLIDFKADRGGVHGWGVSLSSGSLGSGFMDTVGDLTNSLSLGGLLDLGNSVGNTLNSFRTSIFSPVFGIISTITKIVKSVTGSISKIISSFTNPVNQILRDITSIATKATSIALLIESSVNSNVSIPGRTVTNYNNTIRSLKKTSGTISRLPENISEIFKRQFASGNVKRGAAILSSGKKRKKSKAAVLSSGTPYLPHKSYTI